MVASGGTRMRGPAWTAGRRSRWFDGRRLRAGLLDLALLSLLQAGLNAVYGVARFAGTAPASTPAGSGFARYTSQVTIPGLWLLGAMLLCFIAQEALFGATIGKWLTGIRVVALDGGRASFGAVVLRNLLRPLDAAPGFYLIGALSIALSPRAQRLGDRAAGTLVVAADDAPAARRTPRELRWRRRLTAAVLASLLLFSVGFYYFGRPPLVIASEHHLRQGLFAQGVTSYTLGSPRRTRDTITYPVRYDSAGARVFRQDCEGTITLRWHGPLGGGWRAAASTGRCP